MDEIHKIDVIDDRHKKCFDFICVEVRYSYVTTSTDQQPQYNNNVYNNVLLLRLRYY